MAESLVECKVENLTRVRISAEDVYCLVAETVARAQKGAPAYLKNARWKRYRGGSIYIFFVGMDASRALNKKLRNRNAPTDVLSFEYAEPLKDPERRIGEVVVCPLLVKKQAKARGVRFEDELAHVLIHGTMHVFGRHHEKGEEETRWVRAQEDFILHKLGYQPAHAV